MRDEKGDAGKDEVSLPEQFSKAAKAYEKDRGMIIKETIGFLKKNPLIVPMAACCLAVLGGALSYTSAIWEFNEALRAGQVPPHLLTKTLNAYVGGREYGLDFFATLANFEQAPGYAKQAATSAIVAAVAALPLAGYGKFSDALHRLKLQRDREKIQRAKMALDAVNKEAPGKGKHRPK